jgi:putative FmdB family regulatory protein
MPLYEYECPHCGGVVEISRKIAERNNLLPCAKDGHDMQLMVGAPKIRRGGGIHGKEPSAKNWGEYK